MRIFILFSVLVTGFLGFRLAQEACWYASLKERAPAKILRWDIEEKRSRFSVSVVYEFFHKDKNLIGSCELYDRLFMNDATALAAIRDMAKQNWTVHYSAHKPKNSSLIRKFPTGYAVRFLISLLVLIYFLSIRNKFLFSN